MKLRLLLLLAMPLSASAHRLQPAVLDAQELEPGRTLLSFRPVVEEERGNEVRIELPSACGAPLRARELRNAACSLAGGTIRASGLELGQEVFVRVSLPGGRSLSAMLSARAPALEVPLERGSGSVARSYVLLGVEHILCGWDHLLFITALMLLVRSLGALIRTLTAFTLAHSVTLALAATGTLTVSSAAVEVLIALSIVAVAVEARGQRPSLGRRKPWLAAFGFGLLHGLGFSSALSEVGLPPGHLVLALLAFNLGVELGQCVFVLGVRGALWALGRVARWPPWASWAPHEVMGAVAAMWCLERIAAAIG